MTFTLAEYVGTQHPLFSLKRYKVRVPQTVQYFLDHNEDDEETDEP